MLIPTHRDIITIERVLMRAATQIIVCRRRSCYLELFVNKNTVELAHHLGVRIGAENNFFVVLWQKICFQKRSRGVRLVAYGVKKRNGSQIHNYQP